MKVLPPWPRDLASKVVDPRHVDTMTEAGAQSASPWDRGKPSMCHELRWQAAKALRKQFGKLDEGGAWVLPKQLTSTPLSCFL